MYDEDRILPITVYDDGTSELREPIRSRKEVAAKLKEEVEKLRELYEDVIGYEEAEDILDDIENIDILITLLTVTYE